MKILGPPPYCLTCPLQCAECEHAPEYLKNKEWHERRILEIFLHHLEMQQEDDS